MVLSIIQILVGFFLIFFLRKPTDQTSTPLSKSNTNYLRGIAIFVVVAHHVSNNLDTRILTPLGGIGVAIFLIISGYGLNESFKTKAFNSYWSNKIIRVLIPCWIVELVSCFFNIRNFDLLYFIKCLLCIEINWYIRYLFYWYVIFYISSRYFPKYRIQIMGCISTLMLIFLPEIEAEQSLSFFCGVMLSKYTKGVVYLKNHIYLTGVILLVLGISFLGIKQLPAIRDFEGTYIFSIVQLFIKLSTGLAIIVFSWRILNPHVKYFFLGWLGMISYELYLVHCSLLFIPKEYPTLGGIILFYLLSLFFAWILYKIDNVISAKLRSNREVSSQLVTSTKNE